jgi:uncharacterized protein YdcH (DUF465 family)
VNARVARATIYVIFPLIGAASYRTGPGREAETMAEDLKHLLIETNQEFRELASRHHTLDDRLHELESKHFLSDAEQFEEVSLKKRKLQVKDRMELMLRNFRSPSQPGLSA